MTTNLIELIRIKDIERMKKFIADGGDINIQNNEGYTALTSAEKKGYVEIVKLLVEDKARQDLRGYKNKTMTKNIIELVEDEDIEEIKNFIAEGGDVNFQDKDGWRHNWTALDEAVENADNEIVELLIKAGAKGRRTNLITASRRGYKEDVKLLIGAIEEKENLNIQDCDGQTALIKACCYHYFEIMELLIKAGANKNIKDNSGKTALDYAKEERDRHQKIVELLD